MTCPAIFGPPDSFEDGPRWQARNPVKKTRFSEEQMVKILREADSAPVAELAEKYGDGKRARAPRAGSLCLQTRPVPAACVRAAVGGALFASLRIAPHETRRHAASANACPWAACYPRCGYRRIRVLLAREGYPRSADRTHRLWRQAELQVPRKRPRRPVAAYRARGLWLPAARTRSGPMTLSSTPVPTANS